MILVERFCLLAPLALIGASWLPSVPASSRLERPASRQAGVSEIPRRIPLMSPPSPQHEGLGRVLHERVAAEGFLVDVDAQARPARQLEPAVVGLDRAGEERGLLVAGRELHRQGAG